MRALSGILWGVNFTWHFVSARRVCMITHTQTHSLMRKTFAYRQIITGKLLTHKYIWMIQAHVVDRSRVVWWDEMEWNGMGCSVSAEISRREFSANLIKCSLFTIFAIVTFASVQNQLWLLFIRLWICMHFVHSNQYKISFSLHWARDAYLNHITFVYICQNYTMHYRKLYHIIHACNHNFDLCGWLKECHGFTVVVVIIIITKIR